MSRKILIVDEDAHIAELLALILRHVGHATTHAPDGREALALAQRERPDAFLINIAIPGFEGPELCRRLRHVEGFHEAPIVLYGSANASDVDWQGVGADAFLQMPIDVLDLPRVLDGLWRSRR